MPTFAVDDGFQYTVPEDLAARTSVGSIVRVPLSGRRVRGYVTELGEGAGQGLKDILTVSGVAPVFNDAHLNSLRWAASHYVAPLSVVLERAAPPNLPRRAAPPHDRFAPGDTLNDGDGFSEVVADVVGGKKRPVTALVGRWQNGEWLRSLRPALAASRAVLVVAPTAREVRWLSAMAQDLFGRRVVTVAGDMAKELTRAWEDAQAPGSLVIGTPRATLWRYPGLGLALVIEEGRRAMKDRQTPTIHVRDLIMHRALIETFSLAFLGPTPSGEVLASGPEIIKLGNRAWPHVEVIDRSDDPPGSGFLAPAVVNALRAVQAHGGSCFVFTHRRQGDASMRCSNCRRVRNCPECGSRLGRVRECPRCGTEAGPCRHCGESTFEEMGTVPERLAEEVKHKLGRELAAVHPAAAPIQVGTERDLVDVGGQDLVVAADADALIMGHDYRAGEEALRILARLATTLHPGPGRRMMVQTSMPDSGLINTLLRGDPIPHLEAILAERARDRLPPSGEMLALEVREIEDASTITEDLAALQTVSVLGPAPAEGGQRWLLQGSLGPARVALRPMIQHWRDAGMRVRVDADPIDL